MELKLDNRQKLAQSFPLESRIIIFMSTARKRLPNLPASNAVNHGLCSYYFIFDMTFVPFSCK